MPLSPAALAKNAAFKARVDALGECFGLTPGEPDTRGLWFGDSDGRLDLLAILEALDARVKALEDAR